MFLKCLKIFIYSMFVCMFRPHRAIFRQHIWMESTALCPLLSIVLINVRRHYSQFWRFENVFFFYLHIAASLCPFECAAPLVVCTLY
jgi:hypothetical protein